MYVSSYFNYRVCDVGRLKVTDSSTQCQQYNLTINTTLKNTHVKQSTINKASQGTHTLTQYDDNNTH